jgi:hypothetical protein
MENGLEGPELGGKELQALSRPLRIITDKGKRVGRENVFSFGKEEAVYYGKEQFE